MTDSIATPGPASRRGPLREGERVQLTSAGGRPYTVTLRRDGWLNANKTTLRLEPLIGAPEGSVVTSREGREFVAMRPRLQDYILQMPRGATIIYPKDTAQIVQLADLYPGARVLEAGAGSGALSLTVLSAIGQTGKLTSIEIRDDFADIAQANVELWFGGMPSTWDLRRGDMSEVLDGGEDRFDRCVLDMLAPWEHLDALTRVLDPGGVLVCYVATVTQMSRLTEDIRATQRFTEPEVWETTQRGWHVEGLAVRPEHRMIAHTGFLLMTRLLAPGCTPPRPKRRPAKAAEGMGGQWDDATGWDPADAGQRPISAKKLRRVRRDAQARVAEWVHEGPEDPQADAMAREEAPS
ncbi:tRNA (adenine-N1)-methyltransferase [Nanchangia anserum]|uniref:tRNA (Adenine-N1)-methyltransferase n=1 Tax=Nanchangia anserum TaxID=2692125 RepID=A0A8I0GBT6_9ACTO|nr:tRNA (adenine-N1)-methyltransferase [Nanchangia anserum]MBD3688683.1 tRNA (adenine-N1)-methyltransferase [Nanchangia anserum]QOX82434.1 tRNA (adenine-N1)-methyltransferase [Nanchangia anserum]